MNWDAITAIAEIVGVLGLVASLIFVGMQVRQNTLQLRQDNLRDTIRGTLDVNWYFHRDAVAFDVFSKGCKSFDDLSPKAQAHFHSILVDLSFYLGLVISLRQANLIDQDALDVNQRFFLAILCTPGGAQWWEFAKQSRPMPDSAIAFIQSLLDAPDIEFAPITELQPWFASEN